MKWRLRSVRAFWRSTRVCSLSGKLRNRSFVCLLITRLTERLLECLRAHLPPDLLERLPEDPTSNPAQLRTDLLHALSDGQLLCVAYNVALRKSQRPWGFLNPTSIHDIASILKSTPMSRETSESSTPTPTVSNNKTASTGPEGSAPLRRASSDLLSTSEGPLPRVGMTCEQ